MTALHLCKDANAFRAAFQQEMGIGLDEWLAGLVYLDRVAAAILGGVIPLGIGSASTDMDFIIVVDDRTAIKDWGSAGSVASAVKGRVLGESDQLMIAESSTAMNGRDAYVQFVILDELSRRSQLLASIDAAMSLSGHTAQILSRIKTGWMLTETERVRRACEELLQGRALEIHCAVRYLARGLCDLEQAREALSDDLTVALYLGRSCVQAVLSACLAGQGYVYVGNEWVKMLTRVANTTDSTATSTPTALLKQGIALLFPTLADTTDRVRDYLKTVAEFVGECQEHMESDPAKRVAVQRLPQLHELMWAR